MQMSEEAYEKMFTSISLLVKCKSKHSEMPFHSHNQGYN